MNQERRRAARLIKRVPMLVRPVREAPQREHAVEAMNISLRGVYFVTDLDLREGTKLELRLRMPAAIVAGQASEWRFTGRVAHVKALGANQKSGVGVQFLYYSVD